MYLTSAQHDQLRTLIMGFEIPYRSYIAEVILDTYHNKCSFSTALTNAQLSNCQGKTIRLPHQIFHAILTLPCPT